jgi:hypothetical protein
LRSVFAAGVSSRFRITASLQSSSRSAANRRAGVASKAEDCSQEINDLPRFAQPGVAAAAIAAAQAAALAQAHWKL